MRNLPPIVLVTVLGAALSLPILHLLLASLGGGGPAGPTGRHYEDVLASPYFLGALGSTVLFCGTTSMAATVLALPCGWWIARRRAGSRVLRALCQVNFAFSGVVYGMLVVTLLGNAGVAPLLESVLFGSDSSRGYVYTTGGLAIGYLGFQTPRASLLLAQAMERVDMRLLTAARVLGASGHQMALLVLLPLLWKAMVTVCLAVTMISMASFGTALLVARTIEIYPVLVYREFIGFGEINRAAAMGVLLAACCMALEFIARWLCRTDPAAVPATRAFDRSDRWTSP